MDTFPFAWYGLVLMGIEFWYGHRPNQCLLRVLNVLTNLTYQNYLKLLLKRTSITGCWSQTIFQHYWSIGAIIPWTECNAFLKPPRQVRLRSFQIHLASEILQKPSAPITCTQQDEVWLYAPAICTDQHLRGTGHAMLREYRSQVLRVLRSIDDEIAIEPHEPVVARTLIKN